MTDRPDDATRLAETAASAGPQVGLAAVAALRGLLEVLEVLQVDEARAQGWSWSDIAGGLGVSKQAVHHKHAGRIRAGRRR
ncbi:MAG: RNA polymerase subunit sigma-70 [Pseudonocardiales bacterium]|nr:MAG: RNA polymerase subunit sigma-70 [Pseudonocardiales bacterium]